MDTLASHLGIPPAHLLPLAIFVSYFILILYLFSVALGAIATAVRISTPSATVHPAQSTSARTAWATVFGLTAVASLAHTWYHMIQYMRWSYSDAISAIAPTVPLSPLLSLTTWLDRTALFEQAWSLVLQPGVKEWVSSHITSYTVNWVLFLWMSTQPDPEHVPESAADEEFVMFVLARGQGQMADEGDEQKPKDKKDGEERHATEPRPPTGPQEHVGISRYEVACFLLLGQVVAISVASSLFFLLLVLRGRTGLPARYLRKAAVPISVWLPLLGAAGSASIVGMTVNSPYFLANLLVLHFLLFLPFMVPSPTLTPTSPSLLIGSYILSLLLPLPTLFAPLFSQYPTTATPETLPPFTLPTPSLVWNEYRTSNHAFGSIAADVAWCGVLIVLWATYTGRYFGGRVKREGGGDGRAIEAMRRVQEGVASAGWYVVSGSPGLL